MLGKLGVWFKGLSVISKTGVIVASSFLGMSVVGAVAGPQSAPAPVDTPTGGVHSTVETTTKTLTTTKVVPYTTSTVEDSSLAQGTTETRTTGANGEMTQHWEVTYVDGKETGRKLTSEEVTKKPVNEVLVKGTYVAPAAPTNCPNGTYTNSAGNVVCSPYESPSAPSGATAICGDGTYSFSQSRRGTCSHHGGVATWL